MRTSSVIRNSICALFAAGAALLVAACGGGGGGTAGPTASIPLPGPSSPVSAPSPNQTPTPTPSPAPTPTAITLSDGKVTGADDQFTPNDGDTSTGGQGSPLNGVTCTPSPVQNQYHVHWFLGLLMNGKQVALPDTIGIVSAGAEVNGFVNSGTCFYEMHTHDASGLVHIEVASSTPDSQSIFPLGTFFDLWGMNLSSQGVGPFSGQVRVFVGNTTLGNTETSVYNEFTGDPRTIPLNSHEAIWLEVGPTFVLPPQLPAIVFQNEF